MSAGSTVTTVGFWVATLLPFVYLPVFVTGIDTATRGLLFVGFVVVSVVALVVGHEYPETRAR
ncbi:hypothetical protein [Natronobiforma cellulositropha]|uniref:hypothetical protein n=1 Tax=Natronobiforma cellulositropha TaxID=1679076 RepID=UPI0021D58161|nr:hypothetical protein [Natronobiforma cellulositropha]